MIGLTQIRSTKIFAFIAFKPRSDERQNSFKLLKTKTK